MDRALVLLAVAVAFICGAVCRCDPVKVLPNDISLPTSKNESSLREVVVKDDGENKASGGELPDEIKNNSGNKNDVPLNSGETKPAEETVPEEVEGNNGDTSKSIPIEVAPGEECDASSPNTCSNDKKQLIACLSVPGNDSPTLSLLIQNKGALSLEIKISASDFVKLEKNTAMLHPSNNEKVKVSVEDGVTDKPISLVMGEWRCNLSIWDMIPDSIKKNVPPPDLVNDGSSRSVSMVYIPLAAILIIGGVYAVIRLRQRHSHEGTLGYQKLDMVLPISTGGVKEADLAEGWDDSWGDNWDDEEAPMTPSAPSMNLSAKGLASRRINKDGWKD